jgi:repressor LexA
MKGLTPRQKELFDFIVSFQKTRGFLPTYREMKEALRLSSCGTVFKLMKRLEAKEALTTSGKKWRAFELSGVRVANPESASCIGSIARGEKLEFYKEPQELLLPFDSRERTCYFFSVRKPGFPPLHILPGDIVVIEVKKAFRTGELVLLGHGGKTFFGTFSQEKDGFFVEGKFLQNPESFGSLLAIIRLWGQA